MVSQAVETSADQEVVTETQTEVTEEQVSFEDAAATTQQPAAEEERPAWFQAWQEQQQTEGKEREDAAARNAEERANARFQQEQTLAQRRRQAENAQRSNDQMAAQAREERAAELLLVEANRLGVVDQDINGMRQVVRRAVGEAEPIHRSQALTEAAHAVSYIVSERNGVDPGFVLTDREQSMASAFEGSLDQMLRNPQLRERLVAEERRNWEMNLNDEIKKGVEAELARRRNGTQAVRRPAGTAAASTLDTSDRAREERIAYGGALRQDGTPIPLATDGDRTWWTARYGRQRR